MHALWRLVGILGCAGVITLTGCSANGMAPATGSPSLAQSQGLFALGAGWVSAGGLVYHVPQYMPLRSGAGPTSGSGVQFTYHGGPVLVTPKVYLIFWGYKKYGDPDKVAPLLTDYIRVMGGSGHNNIYTQYYDIVDSQTNYIANQKVQLGGVWFDEKNAVPPEPTDAQVAAESLEGVKHFGYDPNGSFVVATPNGRNSEGFAIQWCAYHSATYSGGNVVSYTNLPYIPEAGKSCGNDSIRPPHHPKDESRKDEGVTIVESVEEGESVTDPVPGTGWYNTQYGEIGACPSGGPGPQNDRFRNKSYSVAPMYSDASESCVQTYK